MAHRDMKPENILLESADLSKLSVKLADFGFTTNFEPDLGMTLGCGSLLYMAPEILSAKIYNEKVDIWSLGVITFMLLTGKNPFPGKDREAVKNLIKTTRGHVFVARSPHLDKSSKNAKNFLEKCLDQSVDTRYSAEQLLEHPWIKEHHKLLPE